MTLIHSSILRLSWLYLILILQDDTFHSPGVQLDGAQEDLLELLSEAEVDEEVDGGVGDEGQLVQAGQAQEPGGRTEL